MEDLGQPLSVHRCLLGLCEQDTRNLCRGLLASRKMHGSVQKVKAVLLGLAAGFRIFS
jgi:hypothetical protein